MVGYVHQRSIEIASKSTMWITLCENFEKRQRTVIYVWGHVSKFGDTLIYYHFAYTNQT